MKSDVNEKAPPHCLNFEEMKDDQELEMTFD
jgi:hypothetical protein